MRLVFPEPEYKLRLLEPEHPIWHAEEKVGPSKSRPLWGVESGCRTSVVYVPPDPPARSAAVAFLPVGAFAAGPRGKVHPAVQAQIDAALSLGINVLAYATNRELEAKEMTVLPTTTRQGTGRSRRARPAGRGHAPPSRRLQRGAPGVGEPDGRRRRAKLKMGRTSPHVREELLDITDDALFHYHLVFMHGRTAFHLTAVERRRLKQYIERGGTLMADSICASQAFTDSFRREMAAIFPDHKLEPIPASDPLLSTTYGGFDLRTVSRRDPEAAATAGGPLEATTRKVPPELEGIKFGDHWGVIFSPYRHQLRTGETRFAGMPRLHPRGRRPHRDQRPAVRVSVGGGQRSNGGATAHASARCYTQTKTDESISPAP